MINQGDHQVFMSGNDSEAKQKVSEVLKSFGFLPELSILDLGDITTAPVPKCGCLYGCEFTVLKSGVFNIKIIS